MFEQSNKGKQPQQQSVTVNSSAMSGYLDQLKGTRKWWSKKNSVEYNVILDLLGVLKKVEEDNNNNKAKEGMMIDIYRNLYIKCNKYLDSHKGYRWTSVGRERFRIISAIKNMAQEKMAPILTTNGTQEELRNIEARNKQWKDKNTPVHGFGGLANIIIDNRNITESAYKGYEGLADETMSGITVHLGKSFKIRGLGITRLIQNNMTKGFHDDNVDEETNYNNTVQMRDDFLAGHEDWFKKDDTPENEENVMRNIRALKNYKSIMFRQEKHLYNKYGKFLTQIHPYDILKKTNDLQNDAQLDQDISQVFGAHCTAKTLKELEDSFKDNIESNPILKRVFTKETEKEDRFILISYWYYGFMLYKLLNACTFLKAEMDSKPDLSENGVYRDFMITPKDIEKEKEVEKAASEIGLGKMKGFTPAQKKVYLQMLGDRGMDKDFKVKENLDYKEE